MLWDIVSAFPGALARTHDLLATDGRRMIFSFPGGEDLWGRTMTGGTGARDWASWTSGGLFYLGWFVGSIASWLVPGELVLPREYTPPAPWVRTYTQVLASRDYDDGDVSIGTSEVTITVEQQVNGSEVLLYLRGESAPGEEERWWLSRRIPIEGGGFAPGIRGYQMVQGGAVVDTADFERWVPHDGPTRTFP